ncbi:aldose 1-epimerase family protein [Compostimonas suwonensis]|uniref:Aldose 1-epimerase n=1 Tax=Compostimonas suwonensis TaxID=1048394 RepID=A0A2M9BVD9_9MICO|nr:aldose 1-epimerase family protein [Compostimonas suwonensis]PJJ61920.1 aldose 1-epimerase [Compostimonas suwonensis]
MRAPTGEQYELSLSTPSGPLRAVITEVAAGIREVTLGGVDLAQPFPLQSVPPQGAGIVLVPWPNRVKDGVWSLDGAPQHLAITEPARANAIHGLLRFSPYDLVSRTENAVTLSATVFPQLGYPFLLDTTVSYELVADGLDVTHTVVNAGTETAPVAIGAHPYFTIGDVPAADLTLRVAANTHFEVDERLNVVSEHPVDLTEYDLRAGKVLGDLSLDDGWGQTVVQGGESVHSLTAPDGRSVAMWADESFGYVQVYTTRTFPGAELAVAIEPMTAPTNAFNSGDALHWLEPGEEWSVRWGLRFSGFPAV